MIKQVVSYSVMNHKSSHGTLEDAFEALQYVPYENIEKRLDKGEPLIQKKVRYRDDVSGTTYETLEDALDNLYMSDCRSFGAYITDNIKWLLPLLTEYEKTV